MRVLAIETATMLGALALLDSHEGLMAEVRINVRGTHSERLMEDLDRMLQRADCLIRDVDVIAVSTGPGAFTGLRIGLGTAKGLAFATGIPTVSVPSLLAFAHAFTQSALPVCPMFDARKQEIYAALYDTGGPTDQPPQELIGVHAEKPARFLARLEGYERILFTGQGAELYRSLITETLGERALFAPAHLMIPSAASVAQIGRYLAGQGSYTPAAALMPAYHRKSEVERAAEHKSAG